MVDKDRKSTKGNGSADEAVDDLLRMRAELAKDFEVRLAKLDRRIEKATPGGLDHDRGQPVRSSPRSTMRAKVLDALEDVGWPTYARQLGPYIEARHGLRVPPARFGVLARDEQNAFRARAKRPRPVYICFALTWDRGEPIKRLLARSDWPLEQRLVAPTTGRVQHLKVTVRLCEIAEELGPRAADGDRLRYLIADHARDLPEADVLRGRFELDKWRDMALDELQRLGPRDEDNRRAAAEKLSHRPDWALLFGAPELMEGDADDADLKRAVQ